MLPYTYALQNADIEYHPPEKKEKKIECDVQEHLAAVEVFDQIKDKYKMSSSASEKFLLMTLAPKSWGRNKLASEFNASERQARKVIHLVKGSGILTSAISKKGHVLSADVENVVLNFYNDDENSRLLPGKKDFVSVKKEDGSREHVQKRLILCNLSELFYKFQEQFPSIKIGLSKFAQIRPRNCVLAGASGTHNVCVCVHHENVHLMLDAINIEKLTCQSNHPIVSHRDAIKMVVCEEPTSECFLDHCSSCPGSDSLQSLLVSVLDGNGIDRVEYQIWQQTDRSTLRTEVLDSEDFVEDLCNRILKLKMHSFIAKQQSAHLKFLKDNIQKDEVFLILFDFAENYGFIAQNAAQSFHWNNNQATIFTTGIYYRTEKDLKFKGAAIISDSLNHDTVAVYEYQNIIIKFLKEHYSPKKIIYFTDGASQHFKNKHNFMNLLHHKKDFGIEAEWHFHATAHGKGPCDGIGGNLKRLAARASLQASSKNQILTPNTLYQWAKSNLTDTMIFFSPKSSHEKTACFLQKRFEGAKTVPGTQKYHCFIPTSEMTLILRQFSSSLDYTIFPKQKKTNNKGKGKRK